MSKRKAAGGPGSGLPTKKRNAARDRALARDAAYRAENAILEETAMFQAYSAMLPEHAPESTGMTEFNTSNRGRYMHRRQQLWQNRTAQAVLTGRKVWEGNQTTRFPPEMARFVGTFIVGDEPEERHDSQLTEYARHGPLTETERMMMFGNNYDTDGVRLDNNDFYIRYI